MKKTKTITICASASHYRQVLEVQAALKKLGFTVHVPKTANIMKKTGNFDVSTYKTWYNDVSDYKKKTALILAHFKKILVADAILITNYEKNGLDGYIGGNVLMEMTYAFILKKKIFILNPVDDTLGIREEVYGLQPVFINGDLNKIK